MSIDVLFTAATRCIVSLFSHCTSNEAYLMRESIDSRPPHEKIRRPVITPAQFNVGNMPWLRESREMRVWQRQRVATSQIELVKNNTCVSFASIYEKSEGIEKQ